jgi:hypothetical protein
MYTRTRCNDRQRVRFSLSGRARPTLRSNRRDDLPVERRQFLGTRLGRCLQGGWILPGVEQPQAGSQAGQPKPFEVSLVPELRVDRGQPLAKLCSPRSAAGTHVGEVGGELSGGVRHGRNLALAAGGLNRARSGINASQPRAAIDSLRSIPHATVYERHPRCCT